MGEVVLLSLRSLLEKPAFDEGALFRRIVSIVLEGVSLNSIPYHAAAFSAFQSNIEGVRKRLDRTLGEDEALALAGDTIRLLEDYGAGAERFAQAQTQLTRKTVELLTESLLKVSHGSLESAENLRTIETDLQTVSQMGDLAAINARLKTCLEAICDEAECQSGRGADILGDLDKAVDLESGNPADATRQDLDSVTGLPGVESAIPAIRATLLRRKTAHLFVYAVERMETINLRFGFGIGDQVLFLFAQHIAQRLHSQDALFRWRGPCFVVISAGQPGESMLAADAAKITGTRLEHTITVGEREIIVPINGSWTMLTVAPNSSMDSVNRRIDNFALHRTNTP